MQNDVNTNPEVEPETDPSIGEQNPTGNAEEERAIPYSRFKEINDGYKATKAELETLKGELAQLKTSKPEAEEKEPETWKEVEERAAKRAIEEMQKLTKAEREKQDAIDADIERGFTQLKALGQKITPEVEKQVLEHIVKTGDSVHDAYISIREKALKSETVKQIKDEGYIPEARGKGDKPNDIAIPYKMLKTHSTEQLVEWAKNQKK